MKIMQSEGEPGASVSIRVRGGISITPVSYTHLDVYKRQGRYFLLVQRLDGFQRFIGRESELLVAFHL